MINKLTFALRCLALLTLFTCVAFADQITFSFTSSTTPVTVNTTGLTASQAKVLLVSDTDLNETFLLFGKAYISTGTAASYVATGGMLNAQFNAGPGVEVEVDSASCTAVGLLNGVCLQGVLNKDGAYSAALGHTGSFQALFTVTYVNPFIPELFGDGPGFLPGGSDSLTTGNNVFKSGGTTDKANLGGGAITFESPVPEPGTLALVGSGFMGLAGILRRKINL